MRHVKVDSRYTTSRKKALCPGAPLLLQVVNRTIPESAQTDDPEERERHEWWKAKKWAYRTVGPFF